MRNFIMITPSINSLFFTAFFMLLILILVITNFSKILKLDYYQKIMLLSALAIVIGVHGLIHVGVETKYDYNPYRLIFRI